MTVFLLYDWDMNVLFLLERQTMHRDFDMVVTYVIMTVFLLHD